MTDYREPAPVNPLPPVVVLLFLAVTLPEAAFSLGARGLIGGPEAVGWRLAYARQYGFSGDLFHWMMANGRWMPEHLLRFVTYPFIHHSFTETVFAAVILLALGKLVGETLGQVAVLLIFFGAAIFGALVYSLIRDPNVLLGAFPSAYGLIGGYTYIVWQRLGAAGEGQLRAFRLIAVLMGLQLTWGLFFNVGNGWVADLSGFVFGFVATILLVPGGAERVISHFRRD